MKNLNVVILTHNEIGTIKKCLKALYTHTGNFNLVVIENNSDDGTSQFLSKVNRERNFDFTLIHQYENIGVIKGRNKGYSFAKNIYPDAEYTCFLDSDQFVLKGWQDIYTEWIDKGYDIVGCEAWLLRDDFYPMKKVSCSIDSFSYVGCGGMMLKNSVVEDIELFDDRFDKYYFEDPDFCFRAHQAGYKIGWNYKGLIKHQKNNLSLSGDRKKYFTKNWKKFQEKWKGHEIPVLKMD